MKKHLLFFVCSWLMCASAFAVKQNLDSSLTEKFNGATWDPYAKGIYTSDAQCRVSPINLYFDWNTTTAAWDSSSEYFYTYDANGKVLNYDWKFGYGLGKLKSYSYSINNYSGGLQLDRVTQYWSEAMGMYKNMYRSLYHYNVLQQIDTSFEQTWDSASTSWKVNARIVYNYDAIGNNTLYLYQVYNTGSSSFVNSYKYDYVYTPFKEIDSSYYKVWNAGSSSWPDYQVAKYFYNANHLCSGYETQRLISGTWTNLNKADYTYTANGQIYQQTFGNWTSGSWLSSYRYTYWYGCTQTLGIDNETAAEWLVYPNPVMDKLQVELPEVQGYSAISVISPEGKMMLQQEVKGGKNSIHTESLPAGIYLLQWQNNGQSFTKRFVKE